MAHWAKLDEKNIVIEVVVCDNNDSNNDEGYQWLVTYKPGTWIKTSYNTINGIHKLGGKPLRKNYASVGYTYDKKRDAFIPPKTNCHPEETLDKTTCCWVCTNSEHEVVTDGDN